LYQISVILLHRPFFTRGHLFDDNQAAPAFLKCATAATRLAHIVNNYSHAFTIRRAPYFIAYSAYVATTILIRLSSHQEDGSVPHQCLHLCLAILSESERINAGVKRASFVVNKLVFALARRGPNPFPSHISGPPWGQVVTDKFDIDSARIFQIIDSFSLSSPDASAERSDLESSRIDPGLSGQSRPEASHLPMELDNDSAAQLLASLRSNTPAISELQHTPRSQPYDIGPPLPDIIFGLHNDDTLQTWPHFNNQLEHMMYNWNLPVTMTENPHTG
jgi:hypothetical protein